MDLDLKDRTAIVTGASGGIGRGIAVALAAEGVRLAVVARRKDLLEELATNVQDLGLQRPRVIVQDIMAPGAAELIAETALQQLGVINILVNNAGGHWPAGSDAVSQRWDEAFTLNFFRHRELTRRLLPDMRHARWGRIINITGKSEPENVSGVSVAKAALHAWAKGLSREIGPDGVTINCIAPGRITTEQMLRDYTVEERAAHIEDIPIGEYGRPEDIASLACFLASPQARYITGAVIPVDGGMRRYQF